MQPSQRNQFLTFLFILLFVVFAGEIIYFFYTFKNNRPTNQSISTSDGLTANISSNLSPIPSQSSTLSQGNSEKNIYQEILSNNLKLGALGYFKGSSLTSSYSGRIERINTDKINTSKLTRGYYPVLQIMLRGSSDKGAHVSNIYFNKREYDTAYIYENSKDGAIRKNISDLKQGQTIDVIESLSILDNNKNIYYEISINP